jgi:ABC-type Fe3+-hydroxamate transport system substrate-binding protein
MPNIFVCGFSVVLCVALSGCGGNGSESPTIEAFAPASEQIEEGGSTTLNARFSGGGGAVDQGIGTVQSGSSVTIQPTDNAVYTLTVTAEDGRTVNASTAVRIVYDEI